MKRSWIAIVVVAACGGGSKSPAPANVATGTSEAAPGGCGPVPWRELEKGAEAGMETAQSGTYVGSLAVIEASVPNGSVEKPFILTLERPACMPVGHELKETTEVQIYSPDPAVQAKIDAAVGKRISVTGEAFLSHTAHHHRPIVVDVKLVN